MLGSNKNSEMSELFINRLNKKDGIIKWLCAIMWNLIHDSVYNYWCCFEHWEMLDDDVDPYIETMINYVIPVDKNYELLILTQVLGND